MGDSFTLLVIPIRIISLLVGLSSHRKLIYFFCAQEPVVPGCFLRARAIGLMPMIDQVPVLLDCLVSQQERLRVHNMMYLH